MRKFLLLVVYGAVAVIATFPNLSEAQTCNGVVSNGQNLVTNGDFSQGYAGWTHDDGYIKYTPCASCWSVPGRIYVGSDEQAFNQAFASIPDHSPSADDNSLMVDGVCELGINLWSQSGIPIEPNTNYYFSVWITSLYTNTPRGTLRFDINGSPLATSITHVGAVGTWERVTGVWNSGATPPATATISIQNMNTTGCNDAVDFAIDDIRFTPGCEFGSPGPTPDLGADFSICGRTLPFNINPNFDATNAASDDLRYRWYKDGILQVDNTGPAYYNFSVSAPGTYAVCVDSVGNCPKTDIIVITDDYSIDLGPDQVLCNPVVGNLDAVYTGPGVTYEWYNGGVLIPGETTRYLNPTTPGNYSVTVTDPSCGQQSSSITITTNAAIPQDAEFCPATNSGEATLSVNGPGKYKWFDAPVGGNAVATGPTYTDNFASPGPYTFYVEDTSSFSGSVGPPATGNGFTNPANVSDNDGGTEKQRSAIFFNAHTDFTLDTVTVRPYIYTCPSPPTINVGVFDNAGNHLPGSPVYYTIPPGECVMGTPSSALIKIPLNISVPAGTGYHIRLVNNGPQQSNQIAMYLNTNASGSTPSPSLYPYPQTYSVNSNDVVTFTGNDPQSFNLYYHPEAFPGFFDWKITKGFDCDRVPVTVTENCGTPPGCTVTAPTAATANTVNTLSYCMDGTTTQVTLAATGGSGTTLVWYSGSCGGTSVGNGNNLVVTPPADTTTYFARWESTANGGCVSACASTTVNPVSPPSSSIPGNDHNLCNDDAVTLGATAPVSGTGTWALVSGTISLTDVNNPAAALTGIPEGVHVLSWTVATSSPCADSVDQITIRRDVLAQPILANTGEILDTCMMTTNLNYNTTVDNSPSSTYTWSSTGTLNITASTDNSATVDVGASGGILTITEVKGVCSLDTFVTINVLPDITAAFAGGDRTSCINSIVLSADPASTGGVGQWTVSSGTGTFTDEFDPQTSVSGLSNGVNVFTWTVTGCGGPSSDDVTVDVSASGMVLNASGPADTLCVGTSRDMSAQVTGGSGNYTYHWTSADNSFTLNTTAAAITAEPQSTYMKYYVYASDNTQGGCISNIDSVEIYSLLRQNLRFNNLLTPNNDGRNDKFIIRDVVTLKGILPGSTLEIYNNWGSKVYFSGDYDNGWKAVGIPDGVYFYYLKTGCGGEEYKGWLHIISNENH